MMLAVPARRNEHSSVSVFQWRMTVRIHLNAKTSFILDITQQYNIGQHGYYLFSDDENSS